MRVIHMKFLQGRTCFFWFSNAESVLCVIWYSYSSNHCFLLCFVKVLSRTSIVFLWGFNFKLLKYDSYSIVTLFWPNKYYIFILTRHFTSIFGGVKTSFFRIIKYFHFWTSCFISLNFSFQLTNYLLAMIICLLTLCFLIRRDSDTKFLI